MVETISHELQVSFSFTFLKNFYRLKSCENILYISIPSQQDSCLIAFEGNMRKRSLLPFAICLLYALAATSSGLEDTAYETKETTIDEGKAVIIYCPAAKCRHLYGLELV